MTQPISDAPTSDLSLNGVVLHTRPLRPGTVIARLSRFSDDRWDMSPAIFENHQAAGSIAFDAYPEQWRQSAKQYIWTLLTLENPPSLYGAQEGGRPSILTVMHARPGLYRFLQWAHSMGIAQLTDLNGPALELLADHIAQLDLPNSSKTGIVVEVRRLWTFRDFVPEELKMPLARPWNRAEALDVIGSKARKSSVNRTNRIPDETLSPLLTWAVRFVRDFADDIIDSYTEYSELASRSPAARQTRGRLTTSASSRRDRLVEVLEEFRSKGLGIPGNSSADGTKSVNWHNLARRTDSFGPSHSRYDSDIIEASGLSIDVDTYLTTPCSALIDGSPWRTRPIAYKDAVRVFEMLSTACFIVVAYLSGMRPGEALSLERGCASYDHRAGLWLVRGRYWKGAKTSDGSKAVEGEQRDIPWVVHEVVAEAITVLERMHTGNLLFTRTLRDDARSRSMPAQQTLSGTRMGGARTLNQMSEGIAVFANWINRLCVDIARTDTIAADPSGPISPSRFRRTLAWHIVRRPRGLVAAAIQYGHVAVKITQGYAGLYDAGFTDGIAFEQWLQTVEDIEAANVYLEGGGVVSGPASAEFANRSRNAKRKFAGRILPTGRQASKLLADPSLQVFAGLGMHCVFHPDTALCARKEPESPNLGECKSACTNIARTDTDIEVLQKEIESLSLMVGVDPLAPSIRYQRVVAAQAPARAAIAEHQRITNGQV